MRIAAIAVIGIMFLTVQAGAGVIWYTAETDASSGFSHLYSIDTISNVITDRGEIHGQRYTTDLAFDSNGTLYGIGWNNGQANGDAKLYKLTPGSPTQWAGWALETIKSNAMDSAVNAATMHDGSLYVASSDGVFQQLAYDASKDRWEVSRSGSMGYDSGGDLVFSDDGSKLFVTLAGGALGVVNTDTSSANYGRVTLTGYTGYSRVSGLAMVDGQLYGLAGNGDYCESYLVKIDPRTGLATNAVSLGGSVWGAAGYMGDTAVPEPMCLALLLGGSALLLAKRLRSSVM